jgi:hypothetical protein
LVNNLLQGKGAVLDLLKFCFCIRLMVKLYLLLDSVNPSKDIVSGIVTSQGNVAIENVDLPVTVCQTDAVDDPSYDGEPFLLM